MYCQRMAAKKRTARKSRPAARSKVHRTKMLDSDHLVFSSGPRIAIVQRFPLERGRYVTLSNGDLYSIKLDEHEGFTNAGEAEALARAYCTSATAYAKHLRDTGVEAYRDR